ncbi:roadblock/LC7 domain-containing protein [Myxococcota bacterium]|nr:roadblock/LC7 domain-containing protein [Myxococcota bacterium]MBU1533822.1 roadblock/LC7 domain-containing protein [Myxococcota bacterium]
MFREHLKKLVDNVDGAKAALLMEFDGIEVDHYQKESSNIQTLGTEFSQLMTHARRTAQILDVGGLEEMMVKTDDLILVFRIVNEDYFLTVALDSTGNFGKARFIARLIVPRMLEEF